MVCFFFNDPATSEFYTYGHSLCLHDARPISVDAVVPGVAGAEAESASVEAETATQVTYEQRGIVSGDTLWDIAADELGDGARYPEIFEASKDVVQPGGGTIDRKSTRLNSSH